MRFLNFLFASKKSDSPDTLGAYPEGMQVRALPERRYLKTARFLAIVILLTTAVMMVVAGFFVYVAQRADISIANRKVVNLYTIDSARKVIIPAEYKEKVVRATDLYVESLLRDYIIKRNEIVWDNNEMKYRWGDNGPIAGLSDYKRVYSAFQLEADLMFSESRTNNFVRDVHLYDLVRLTPSVWEGVFDTFDMPIPDSYKPLCPCKDNSKACIECKKKHTTRHQRFRVVIRIIRVPEKKVANPLGYQIRSYNVLYVPIREGKKYWDIPADLKPDL